ncbi:cation:proton antiporter [Halovibrio sp. HP20-50]|uniref:cation:proton antiporter n=1 Tax=Halovibrio sp. HP20-59 TaxID=3080275 RepID=UPI00294AA904|nr:cation:proton antiporter [Halovibrio sp. HP20-59]MEA2117287.1 cation:proton antiporter [Halovibrio sp. HP20-59]
MEILLTGVLLLSGLALGALGSRLFGLPRVVGYILVGMLFAPSLLGGQLGIDDTQWTQPLVSIALGVIAYVIGGAISPSKLRRLGWSIAGATLGEVSGAFLVVVGAVLLLGMTVADLPLWSFALVLGALAPATAPAAIVAVVHQYRARGPLTTTLLGMVAIDDALGILIFALVMAVAGSGSLGGALGTAFWEVGVALLVGGGGGFLIERLSRHFHEKRMLLPLLLSGILLTVGLATWAEFSALLAAMVLGFSVQLFCGPYVERLFEPIEDLEETVFVLFFTFAGLHFTPSVVIDYWPLVLTYFIARAVGLFIGGGSGARLAGAPRAIWSNIGFGLFPQGGVAIGLALLLMNYPMFSQAGEVIVNLIATTTLLTESVGAISVRYGLHRAGELYQNTQNEKTVP